MNKLKNIVWHFNTIRQHRKWVRYYCFKAGLYKQSLLHDLSKYTPTEFCESVKYYTGISSPVDMCKKEQGYSMAWLHHRGCNKHHYEYWVDNLDKGGEPNPMPYQYALEMVCDNIAASRTYMKDDFTYQGVYDWWLKKTENQIAMHPATQYFVTEVFKELAFCESVTPITRRHLKTYLKHSSLNKWCKGMNKYKYWRAENGSETQN